MILSIQGLRTGTGSSFVAANLADVFSRTAPVALVSTTPAPGTFETYWNLSLTGDKSWLRQVSNDLPLAEAIERPDHGFPVLFPFGIMDVMTDESANRQAEKLLALLAPHAFTHTVIDAGAASSRWAKAFSPVVDMIVTVLEPDHDALLRLMHYAPRPQEVFLINKVVPGSQVGYRLTSFLETEPRFIGKLVTPLLPQDEAARESGFLMTRVVKSAPHAAITQALLTVSQSLLTVADRLGLSPSA